MSNESNLLERIEENTRRAAAHQAEILILLRAKKRPMVDFLSITLGTFLGLAAFWGALWVFHQREAAQRLDEIYRSRPGTLQPQDGGR